MADTPSEMEANYPYFRAFVYAKIKEEFDRTVEPLQGNDLEEIARQEDGRPLETFIREIEAGTGS